MIRRIFQRLHLRLGLCPKPPNDELVQVVGTLQGQSIWEFRRCPVCKIATEWRRDSLHEPFEVHSRPALILHLGGSFNGRVYSPNQKFLWVDKR